MTKAELERKMGWTLVRREDLASSGFNSSLHSLEGVPTDEGLMMRIVPLRPGDGGVRGIIPETPPRILTQTAQPAPSSVPSPATVPSVEPLDAAAKAQKRTIMDMVLGYPSTGRTLAPTLASLVNAAPRVGEVSQNGGFVPNVYGIAPSHAGVEAVSARQVRRVSRAAAGTELAAVNVGTPNAASVDEQQSASNVGKWLIALLAGLVLL